MSNTCVLPHRHQPDRPRAAAPGTHVCRGCTANLRRALIGEDHFAAGVRTRSYGLAELHTQLEEMLIPGGGGGERHSGSREPALPFTPAVSTHRRDITEILGSWVLQHMADVPETGPGTIDPAVTTFWLELRLGHALAQDWVVDYAAELRALRGKALALLDPVRRTRFVIAQCARACDGWLVADIATNDRLLPAVIYCDSEECGQEWPPHRWIELGRALGRDQAA